MKRLLVGLPDGLRARLEGATAKTGGSLAEEIRRRLQESLDAEADFDPQTRKLMGTVGALAAFIKLATGLDWHRHAGAHRTLGDAILAYLARVKPAGEPNFAPGELPANRLVAAGSDDPSTIGLAIEAAVFYRPPMTPESRRRVEAGLEASARDLIERYPDDREKIEKLIQESKRDLRERHPDDPEKEGEQS